MIKSQCSLISLILLTLTACSSSQTADKTSKYQPVVNPHPQYFVTVSGHIDPQLAKAAHLSWGTTALTQNPKCNIHSQDKIKNLLPQQNDITTYPVKTDAQGNYQIKIPIDRYLPGFCQWRMRIMFYKMQYFGNIPIAIFSQKYKKLQNRSAGTDIDCYTNNNHQLICHFLKHYGSYGYLRFSLNPNQSYQYKLNIYQKPPAHPVENNRSAQ